MSKFDQLRKVRSATTGVADNVRTQQPGRERPTIAKRNDKANYTQVTAYIERQTYTAVKHALVDERQEFSELVQTLLDNWIKTRN